MQFGSSKESWLWEWFGRIGKNYEVGQQLGWVELIECKDGDIMSTAQECNGRAKKGGEKDDGRIGTSS